VEATIFHAAPCSLPSTGLSQNELMELRLFDSVTAYEAGESIDGDVHELPVGRILLVAAAKLISTTEWKLTGL
jgi:hypothetical protein